ncbi:MAG: 50S ribosomal L9 C-terminal domain-containing protein, partial [Candidatus Yanofskybacteria bacterium]|nr:50S ribosomal L9 C-terminal domain-containing protein [Candidatus Yanofskybacteria bacterium]
KANEKGTLFDGIEKKDIAKAIKDQKGVAIEENNVQLDGHIKHTGEHTVTIELAPEITVPVKVIVNAQ